MTPEQVDAALQAAEENIADLNKQLTERDSTITDLRNQLVESQKKEITDQQFQRLQALGTKTPRP